MSVSRADYVWVHMAGLYGHRWVSSYGENARGAGGQEWSLVLADLSHGEIDIGLDACRCSGDDWPPSAPAFRATCLGVPSIAAVRSMLRHGEPSPFTRAVWAELDSFRYQQTSADQADRMLRDAYGLVRERVMRGQALPPEPAAALEQEVAKSAPATPEQAAAHIASIHSILHGDQS